MSDLDELEDLSDLDELEDLEGHPMLDELVEELDPDDLHGILHSYSSDQTHYLVVAQSVTQQSGAKALDLRTCVVDLSTGTVSVSDNGLWVPLDSDVSRGLIDLLISTTADLRGRGDGLSIDSAVDEEVLSDILSAEVEGTYEETEDDDSEDWQSPPPEIDTVRDRLNEVGISQTERYIMCEFYDKEPYKTQQGHILGQADDMKLQYGVYAHRDDPLVLVDIDDPELAPELLDRLPETFRVDSASGPTEQSHLYYKVSDLDHVEQELGRVNVGPSWGEVRSANQYVVGPGCELDDGRSYQLLENRPIAELPAEELVELLLEDPAVQSVLDATDQEEDHDEESAESAQTDSTPRPDQEEDLDDDLVDQDTDLGLDLDQEEDHDEESAESAPETRVPVETDLDGEYCSVPPAVEDLDASRVLCYQCDMAVLRSEAVIHASDETTEWFRCAGGCQ